MFVQKEKYYEELQKLLRYVFQDRSLLRIALTHSSFANEAKGRVDFNERLEFLGDSVLSITVSEYIYKKYPEQPEGILTRIRAGVVSETSLAELAREIGLGHYLRLGRGEEATGGKDRSSILADAVESVIGAIYLDGGLNAARDFVLRHLAPAIEQMHQGRGHRDYKTELQELLQKDSVLEICYRIIDEQGPDHEKSFVAQVCHGGKAIGQGFGKSKKDAEQQAANAALEELHG